MITSKTIVATFVRKNFVKIVIFYTTKVKFMEEKRNTNAVCVTRILLSQEASRTIFRELTKNSNSSVFFAIKIIRQDMLSIPINVTMTNFPSLF